MAVTSDDEMSRSLADQIRSAIPASDARAVEGAHMPTIEVGSTEMPDVLAFLRDLPGHEFKLFCDATAIDREADRGLVEVVYIVRSTVRYADLITLKTAVDAAEPSMPTSANVLAGANWAEREIYDMFGIRFDGHPDLRRILLSDDWVGHPLLKSYAVDTPHPPYR